MGLKLSSVPFEISYPAQSFGVEIENLKLHKNLSFDTIAAIKNAWHIAGLCYSGIKILHEESKSQSRDCWAIRT